MPLVLYPYRRTELGVAAAVRCGAVLDMLDMLDITGQDLTLQDRSGHYRTGQDRSGQVAEPILDFGMAVGTHSSHGACCVQLSGFRSLPICCYC